MTDPAGVLLVVPPGPLRDEGPCGDVPPRVSRYGQTRRWFTPQHRVRGVPAEAALPLWWEHMLVPDGWDRIRRYLRELRLTTGVSWADRKLIESLTDVLVTERPSIVSVRLVASSVDKHGLARAVYVNDVGLEVPRE